MGYRKDILDKGKNICDNKGCEKDISKKEYLYSMKKVGKPLCSECKRKETALQKPKLFSKVSGFERYKLLKKKE
tara:strand:- start:4002 stop:4223 length:222 start_codon:yes stop_codon:yes gene_type:complete